MIEREREVEICERVWVGDEKSVNCIFCLTGDNREGNAPYYPEATLTNQGDTAEVKLRYSQLYRIKAQWETLL